MRDEFTLAIVTGVGVPEVADVRFFIQLFCQSVVRFRYQVLGLSDERACSHNRSLTQGKTFQRRSHQLRVSRSVSFVLQVS